MDRRSFIESCTAGAACLSAAAAVPVFAADARPKSYARSLLVNEQGDPLRARDLKAQSNYVFHYPFEATPVFLLDLGKAAPPRSLGKGDTVDHRRKSSSSSARAATCKRSPQK